MSQPSSSQTPLHARRSITGVFFTILSDNLTIIQGLRTNALRTFTEEAVFATIIWIFYSLTTCSTNPDLCDSDHWLIGVPVRTLSYGKGSRELIFEYLWNCMCAVHFSQAFLYGVVWTLKDSMLVSQAGFTVGMGGWQKTGLYLSNFTNIGLGLVVQPLLTFYVSREMRLFSPWFGSRQAESKFCMGLVLHAFRIVFETLEEVAYDQGLGDTRLMMAFLVVCMIATFDRK